MKRTFVSAVLLSSTGYCFLLTSCKPSTPDQSELMANAVATTKAENIVDPTAATIERFNFAEYIKTHKIGSSNFANNVAAGNKYVFFTSNEVAIPSAEKAKETAVSPNKAEIKKAAYRFETNLLISTSHSNSEVSANWWADAYLRNIHLGPAAARTLDIGASGKETNGRLPTVKTWVKAFNQDIVPAVDMTNQQKFSKKLPLVNLNVEHTVLGIPKLLGVETGVRFTAELQLNSEVAYGALNALVLNFSPKVIVTAGLDGGVKALVFASAKGIGTITVLDTTFASSASIGGNSQKGWGFGNVTFDGQPFKALAGTIEIVAKLGPQRQGLEAAFWDVIADLYKETKLPQIYIGWDWKYTVWSSPPLVNVVFPAFYSKGFTYGTEPNGGCAETLLNAVAAGAAKEEAKDLGALKSVGESSRANFKLLLAKVKSKFKVTSAKPCLTP